MAQLQTFRLNLNNYARYVWVLGRYIADNDTSRRLHTTRRMWTTMSIEIVHRQLYKR